MTNSQWQVSTFMSKYVPHDLYPKFHQLMIEWDGSQSVRFAFYDLDVLQMKLKEAKEWMNYG
jgi:hypothetical protein